MLLGTGVGKEQEEIRKYFKDAPRQNKSIKYDHQSQQYRNKQDKKNH